MSFGQRCGLGLLLAGMLAACGAAGAAGWTGEAQAWIAGYDDAFESRQLEHELYYAPDAVYDGVLIRGRTFLTEGRDQLVRLTRSDFAADVTRGELHLGPRDAVRTVTWDRESYGVSVALVHLRIGEEGIVRETLLAPTWMQRTVAHGQSDAAEAASAIAEEYLAAWSAGQPDRVRDMYAPDAALSDALVGGSAVGAAAIAALAAESAPVSAETIADVFPERALQAEKAPAAGEPAVFLDLEVDRPRQPTQVWLAIRAQAPCTGSVIVALELDDDQRIIREQRFPSAQSLSRCSAANAAVPVWWTDRPLPPPFGERVTGNLATDGGSVEIRNGSDVTDTLVLWAYDRFQEAGLPAPHVAAIRFDPFDERCEDLPGYADWSDGTTQILMCFDSSGLRPPSGEGVPPQGHLVLHEIGHAWVVEHTDEETRQAFMERAGVADWNDKGEPWRDRGAEWAAEALSWGLKGSAGSSVPLGMPTCDVLADGFRILTGAEPLTQCQVEPE